MVTLSTIMLIALQHNVAHLGIADPFRGLILSQMLLSVQLPFTIFSQVYLTSSEKVMGKYRNTTGSKIFLYGLGVIVTVLNVVLLISLF